MFNRDVVMRYAYRHSLHIAQTVFSPASGIPRWRGFYNPLGMKNLELVGTERLLESVLREYATKSCPDEMRAFRNGIPEPKLSLLIEAMPAEDTARFREWAADSRKLDAFKAGPAIAIDRMKEQGETSAYELIRRFEELQAAVDREIMKYELWMEANPLEKPGAAASLAAYLSGTS